MWFIEASWNEVKSIVFGKLRTFLDNLLAFERWRQTFEFDDYYFWAPFVQLDETVDAFNSILTIRVVDSISKLEFGMWISMLELHCLNNLFFWNPNVEISFVPRDFAQSSIIIHSFRTRLNDLHSCNEMFQGPRNLIVFFYFGCPCQICSFFVRAEWKSNFRTPGL